jgi:hypothetical protein
MFSVIASLTVASGSPATTQIADFENYVRNVYDDTAIVARMGIAETRQAVAGIASTGAAVFTLSGRASASSATKAKGVPFAEGETGRYNIVTTYEAPEGLKQSYDWTDMGDARFTTMSQDAATQVIVEAEIRDKRFLAMCYITQRLGALAGYLQAPGDMIHTDPAYTSFNAYYTLDNTGAERVFADLLDVWTDMTNSNRKKGPKWVCFMRVSVQNALRMGTRFTSKDYVSDADGVKGEVLSQLLKVPIVAIPDHLWPSTSATYADKSFTKYNVDATFAGANGAPAFFLINYGNGISPIAETIPPIFGGISVRAYSDDDAEVDTALVKARYAYDSFMRDAIGAARLRAA